MHAVRVQLRLCHKVSRILLANRIASWIIYKKTSDLGGQAKKISFPSSRVAKVKDEATQKAFQEISESDVEILREIYANDFYILDHDPYLYHGYSRRDLNSHV